MNLRQFDFLADENIHPQVVEFLRGLGVNVARVEESGLASADDLTVIRKARLEKRVVLTHDSDFGALAVAAGEPTAGIVYLRPGHIRASFTIAAVMEMFRQELDLSPPFIVVLERKGGQVRIRVPQL